MSAAAEKARVERRASMDAQAKDAEPELDGRCSTKLQLWMQKGFAKLGDYVITSPNKVILMTLVWVSFWPMAALTGTVELRNEEVLLPQDARELDAQAQLRETFGWESGRASVLLHRADGGDMLNVATLREVAALEAELLALNATDAEDESTVYGFADICEEVYPGGGCFYISLFGTFSPWADPAAGPEGALDNLLAEAASLEGTAVENVTSAGLQLAIDAFENATASDMFMSNVLGSRGADGAVTHLSISFMLRGVFRETLLFRVWDVFGNLPAAKPPERWESKLLDWFEERPVYEDAEGYEHATSGSLVLYRGATSSTASEMLYMVLWSVPLVIVVLVLMCNYVLLVFVRRPFKVFGKSRIKLAIAGVGGVQVSPTASLYLLVGSLAVVLLQSTAACEPWFLPGPGPRPSHTDGAVSFLVHTS